MPPHKNREEAIRAEFVSKMESELISNGHKGNWKLWCPEWEALISEAKHHLAKLDQAKPFPKLVSEYAADVANFMMKFDECFGERALPASTAATDEQIAREAAISCLLDATTQWPAIILSAITDAKIESARPWSKFLSDVDYYTSVDVSRGPADVNWLQFREKLEQFKTLTAAKSEDTGKSFLPSAP